MYPAIVTRFAFVATCLSLVGCDERGAGASQENRQHQTVSDELANYLRSGLVEFDIVQLNDSPRETDNSVGEPPTFCEFVYQFDGGFGEYEVVEIVETLERTEGSVSGSPWTYYVLRAIGPRAPHSPETLTLRTTGGPLGEDRWISVDTGFELGEEAFVFYVHAREGLNAGFATPFSHLVFRGSRDTGYSSIWYFTGNPTAGTEIASLAQTVLDEFGHTLHELPYRGAGFDVERCPLATTTLNDFDPSERVPEDGSPPVEVDTSRD